MFVLKRKYETLSREFNNFIESNSKREESDFAKITKLRLENLKLKGYETFKVLYAIPKSEYSSGVRTEYIDATSFFHKEDTVVFEGANNEFIAKFNNVISIVKE